MTYFDIDSTLPRGEPSVAENLTWINDGHAPPVGRQVNAWADHHGSVRLGTLLPLADILPDLGVDPAQLLAECGVDPKVFEDPDPQILLLLHNRLVALAVARSGCPHIGLLVRYSPAVETALRSFVRYLHTCARREVDARGG